MNAIRDSHGFHLVVEVHVTVIFRIQLSLRMVDAISVHHLKIQLVRLSITEPVNARKDLDGSNLIVVDFACLLLKVEYVPHHKLF